MMKCRRCGEPLVVSVNTFESDPDGRIFDLTLRAVKENALCDFHSKQRAWYSQQGRLEDWEKGNT